MRRLQSSSITKKSNLASIIKVLWFFHGRAPAMMATTIAVQFMAGFLESFGVIAILPAVQLIQSSDGSAPKDGISAYVFEFLGWFGIPATVEAVLLLVCGMVTAKVCLNLLAGILNTKIVLGMVDGIRTDISHNLLNAQWSHFVSAKTGYYVNILGNETNRVVPALYQGIGLITDAIHAALYIFSALLISVPITALSIFVGLIKLLAARPVLKMARHSGQLHSQHNATLSTLIVEIMEIAKPIKAMAREEDAERLLRAEISNLQKSQGRSLISSMILTNTDELLLTISLSLCFYVTAQWLHSDIAALAIVGILMSRTLAKVGSLQKRYLTTVANEAALFQLLDVLRDLQGKQERPGVGAPPTLESGIELRDLKLTYGDRVIVDGLNIHIKARTMTVLEGPSGSGKTTLIDALIGLKNIQGGTILIDGHPLDSIDQRAWRQTTGYVPQESTLLHGTVFDNITLRAEGISEEEVIDALRAAEALDFVMKLPHGLQTMVGERGMSLSGGQRQRLSIARAIVRRPKLLILDEATTALDPATEAEICQTLRRLTAEVTIIAISHQPAMGTVADKVYRLKEYNQNRGTASEQE